MARLVIFDVDGTLVDSQEAILTAMAGAFELCELTLPPRATVLGIVGLSLPQAMAELCPEEPAERHAALVAGYKASYRALREAGGGEDGVPFFPGALAALDRLGAAGHTLGIATGKARRGLDHMLDSHDLRARFKTTQSSDDAPSKPDPGMVLNCLAETGANPADTVVVGDTEFDMAMARAAGVGAIGVAWGYHAEERLHRGGAMRIVSSFEALDAAIADLRVPS